MESIPRKDAILEAARNLFSSKGFSATGMREIATTAGVSLGNLYNHFPAKDDIFAELLRPEPFMEHLAGIPEILKTGSPSNIDLILLAFKETVDSNIELFRLILIDFIEFDGAHTNRIVETLVNFSKTSFDENIVKANLVGTSLRDIDYDLAIKLFIAAVISFFVFGKTLPAISYEHYDDRELAQKISDIFQKGIAL